MWAGIGLHSRLELSTKHTLSKMLAENEQQVSSEPAQAEHVGELAEYSTLDLQVVAMSSAITSSAACARS
jgi:hypothetical protein